MNSWSASGRERPQCLVRQLGGDRLGISREGVVGQADDVPEAGLGERAAQRCPHGLSRGVAVYEQHGEVGVALGDVLRAPAPASPQRVRKLQGRHPHGSQFLQRRHVYQGRDRRCVIPLDLRIAASGAAASKVKQKPFDQPFTRNWPIAEAGRGIRVILGHLPCINPHRVGSG